MLQTQQVHTKEDSMIKLGAQYFTIRDYCQTIEDFEGTYYFNCAVEVEIIFDAKEQLDLFIMSLKLEDWIKYVDE